MHEILASLPAGARVLDLGCQAGSFPAPPGLRVVRLDRDRIATRDASTGGQADAAHLPFAAASFDAVISNHSLEHFDELQAVLHEVRRVLRPPGALYVAVPDATTLTDRLYRWMARGGGHVNAFRSRDEVATLVSEATGLPCVGGRTLFTSLSFLHRRNQPPRTTRKLWLFAGGREWCLRWVNGLLRLADRQLGTRTSVYGWALYFGGTATVDAEAWVNVCVGCGSGYPRAELQDSGRVRPGWPWGVFTCPQCGSRSPFFPR